MSFCSFCLQYRNRNVKASVTAFLRNKVLSTRKTIILCALFLFAGLGSVQLSAQPAISNLSPSSLGEASGYSAASAGPHHRVWVSALAQTNSAGKVFYHTNSFTELATGLNHLVGDEWVKSSEDIQITATGGTATNTQHHVNFNANINTPGSIDLRTPGGRHLTGTVLGMSLYDTSSQQNVIIARLQDSIGQILPTGNQVLYPNALVDSQSGLEADVLYTHKRTGFEQDVVLHQHPPDPASLGLNPLTTMLQVWTEFYNTQDPDASTNAIAVPVSNDAVAASRSISSETLTFGSMEMNQGNAFATDGSTNISATGASSLLLTPVSRHWVRQAGRKFLVEEVPFNSISQQLSALPAPSAPAPSNGGTSSNAPQSFFRSPAKSDGKLAKTQSLIFAKTSQQPRPGFVMDYNLINNNFTNFTFLADTTYYLSGTVNLYGTTSLEGGTVIKCDTGGEEAVVLNGNVRCLTAPYRPAIFTCTNDNSVGVALSTSNSPTLSISTFLYCPHGGSITNVRFSYAWNAISGLAGDIEVTDCQFVNCSHAITANSATTNLGLHNVLISMNDSINNTTNFCSCTPGAITLYSTALTMVGEHVTADAGSQNFITYYASINPTNTTISFTNSIIISPHINPYYSWGAPVGITVATNSTLYAATRPTNLFQSVGAASYYLGTNSPALAAGNTNINPDTLTDVRQKTTHPPVVYRYTVLTNNITLYPVIPRDNGSNPDEGYHYDPLDFAFSSVYVGSNVTVTVNPGTAIAGFQTNVTAYAMCSGENGVFVSEGAPTALNRIVNYNTVQEQSTTNWFTPAAGLLIPNFSDGSSSVINCRFTDFSSPAQDVDFFGATSYTTSPINLMDCQLHGGTLDVANQVLNLTNCLFERVNGYSFASGLPYYIRNNLFWGGSIGFYFDATNTLVQNNMFYDTSVSDGGNTNYIGGYNGYFGTSNTFLTLTNSTDQILTIDPGYVAGPLGNYYLTNSSALIDVGSTNANLLGLYHYTTQVDQGKETTSPVDIGYHYIALNSSGMPNDADGDGFPDYIEDANGNGNVDSGETAWNDFSDLMGLRVYITRPTPASNLP